MADSGSERSASPEVSTGSTNHSGSDKPITLRFMASMKEAGGIIGKGGENIRRFRDESGARINITDPSSAERIVAVVGTSSQIKTAFRLIAEKFEEDLQSSGQDSSQVSFRLVIPNSNCGSLIGKSGANIKELRELTGATIQVANEMLPNSTERNVVLSGPVDSVMKALDKICVITVETKSKGPVIPYQPSRGGGYRGEFGGLYNGGRQQGAGYGSMSYGGYAQRNERMNGRGSSYGMMGDGGGMYGGGMRNMYSQDFSYNNINGRGPQGGGVGALYGGGGKITTKEVTISSEMVGAIIGRQGSRISEIRQNSGASIKIADAEEGSTDRTVIISGPMACVRDATYLIKNFCTRYKSAKGQ